MTTDTDFQVIRDESGKPAFLVVPYARFQAMAGGSLQALYRTP